jgi:hypothetical protein
MQKGINAADILDVMLMLPKDHPKRLLLINLMNTALLKRVLPQAKEDVFHKTCKELIKEGLL